MTGVQRTLNRHESALSASLKISTLPAPSAQWPRHRSRSESDVYLPPCVAALKYPLADHGREADVLPLLPGARATAAYPCPPSWAQVIKSYAKMVCTDAEYGRGVAIVWGNQIGEGLLAGGFFNLLNVLGVADRSLPLAGVAVFGVVEAVIALISHSHASSQRDRALGKPKSREAELALGRARLAMSGYINLVAALCLVATSLGVIFLGLETLPLVAAMLVSKVLQGFATSLESSGWHTAKMYLGSPETKARQVSMPHSINALEFSVGHTLLNASSFAAYGVIVGLGGIFPHLFLTLILATLGVGAILTTLPKFFL